MGLGDRAGVADWSQAGARGTLEPRDCPVHRPPTSPGLPPHCSRRDTPLMRGSWRGPRACRERGRGAWPEFPLASALPVPWCGAGCEAGGRGQSAQGRAGPPRRRAGLGEGRHVTRPGLPLCSRARTARSGRRSDPGSRAPTDAAPSLHSLREPTAGPLPFVLLGKAVGQRLCDVNWWLACVLLRERRWGPALLLPRRAEPRGIGRVPYGTASAPRTQHQALGPSRAPCVGKIF